MHDGVGVRREPNGLRGAAGRGYTAPAAVGPARLFEGSVG